MKRDNNLKYLLHNFLMLLLLLLLRQENKIKNCFKT
jgi:hypothetical protein